jgi:hypothetical protein
VAALFGCWCSSLGLRSLPAVATPEQLRERNEAIRQVSERVIAYYRNATGNATNES